MRSIRIDNPVLNTYLTDVAVDYTTSLGVTLTARSNNSFAADDLIVIGNPSEELTEQKKVSALSGNTILTLASALKFPHNKGTLIYKSMWDYFSIEGRSSSAGVFAELSQSPIQWDNQDNKTIYIHAAGNSDWEYRIRRYNSITASYSEYSPTLTGAGFSRYQMGYLIREARRIAGDKAGRIMTTDELLRAATRAKNIIRAHNSRYWFWKVLGYNSSKSFAATANNNVYSLASITDIGTLDGLEFRYNNGGTDTKYELRRLSDAEFNVHTRDLNRPVMDHPRVYRLLPPDSNSPAGYIEILNKMQNSGIGTFYPNYYKNEPDYTSVEDETAILMPEILEDYLISEIAATKGNEAMQKKYYKLFTGPENREKTLALADLTGIALLDELDRQYKEAQGQPKTLWRFRGQKAMSRLYGSRQIFSADYIRENYFNGDER